MSVIDRDGSHVFHEQGAQQERSVFVCPYEQVEVANRFIPSIIRLNALDYVQRICRNGTRVSKERGCIRGGEVSFLRDNRECDLPLLTVVQNDGRESVSELPCNVVETGTKIGDKIPDYAREQRRRLGCDDTFDTYIVPSLLVVIS
jgi:hypothetical protein